MCNKTKAEQITSLYFLSQYIMSQGFVNITSNNKEAIMTDIVIEQKKENEHECSISNTNKRMAHQFDYQ